MEYNTSRSRMLMPEYGRNVQKMIEYLGSVEDREKRLQQAEIIIELMGTLNPHLKTIEDYKHKLWDHLFQMTNFSLDVDSPYPCPTPESVFKKPEPLPYPQQPIKHRHLGKNLERLLEKAVAETSDEKRYGFTQAVGYYMKLAYATWHKEPVHDDMIKNELNEISGGTLRYEPGGFKVYFDPTTSNNNNNNRSNNYKQRNNNNNNNNNNRNFKGQGGQGGNRNNNGGNGFRDNNPNSLRSPDNNNNNNSGGGYGNNNFNKNRKFNKNKPKPQPPQ